MKTPVNSQGGGHYRRLEPQPWDIIHAWGLDYFLGNVVKYVARAGHKGDAVEDLEKARHYLDKKIAILKRLEEPPLPPIRGEDLMTDDASEPREPDRPLFSDRLAVSVDREVSAMVTYAFKKGARSFTVRLRPDIYDLLASKEDFLDFYESPRGPVYIKKDERLANSVYRMLGALGDGRVVTGTNQMITEGELEYCLKDAT